MTLSEFVDGVEGFNQLGPTDKIRHFAWFLIRHGKVARFRAADLTACFADLHLHLPANLAQLVTQLVGKDFIKDAQGLRPAKTLLDRFDGLYGQRLQTVAVHELLAALPSKLVRPEESDYLVEALKCFKVGAFRAAIVMTWNVAYDHLLTALVEQHLHAFNAALKQQNVLGGKRAPVSTREDFQRWQEVDVIEVCRLSRIVSKEVAKVLSEKLEKRNSAAHASGSTFDQVQVEAYISDLVKNAVLKL